MRAGRSIRIGVGLAPVRGAPLVATRLWLPSDLGSKVLMWLEGDQLAGSNGSNVPTWTDESSNGNNATGVGGANPTLVTADLNGYNVVKILAGSGQSFTLPTTLLSGLTQAAAFTIYNNTGNDIGPVFGDFGTDALDNHEPYSDGNIYDDFCTNSRRTVSGLPNIRNSSWHSLGLRSKASDWRCNVDGTNYLTDATNTVAVNSAPLLGKTGSGIMDGKIAVAIVTNDFLTDDEFQRLEGWGHWKYGLQSSLPGGHPYASAAPTVGASPSHDTTGALVGPGSTIAGTAAHIAIHTSTGVLTGPGSTIVGTAARTREHATTGILTGAGSVIVGAAVYNAKHTTSGALTGAGSVIVGSAARTRAHATTGALTGAGSVIVGAAVYNAKHTTTGALTGPGSTVAGSAARFRAFATSGVLVGPGSTIAGSADHAALAVTVHATSGALIGQPSIIDGIAARTRQHDTSGVLTGPPALVVGVVTRWRNHDTSGALLGVTGVVFGRAFNGTPQLHDIPVDSDNLTDEPVSPSGNLSAITEPSGQIVNHPPYPAA